MIVYKTTNLINGKIYVGQDESNNDDYIGSGKIIKQAIKKYGIENFKKEVLEHCKTKKQLCNQEKYWIKKLDARNHEIGYNIQPGGEGGYLYKEGHVRKEMSPEARNNLRKSKLGKKRKPFSEEWKKNMGEASKGRPKSKEWLYYQNRDRHGENHFMYRKTYEEYYGEEKAKQIKDKQSESHKKYPERHKYWLGKKQSPESNKKRSITQTGRKYPKELYDNRRGENNAFYGKHHTDETIKILKEIQQNKTPEQRLEIYKKFYITKCGKEPTQEQLNKKYIEYKEKKNESSLL